MRRRTADRGDILTYVLGGTGDESFFKINKMTGQLTIGVQLDAERDTGGNDAYTVTVTAHDPSDLASDPAATVTVTASDVNEAPTVELTTDTMETLRVNENHDVKDVAEDPEAVPPIVEATGFVLGTYEPEDQDVGDSTADSDPLDSSEVELSLGGDDADQFVLDEDDGQLRFKASPNFESPTDANQDNSYKVTIVATDKKGLKGDEGPDRRS